MTVVVLLDTYDNFLLGTACTWGELRTFAITTLIFGGLLFSPIVKNLTLALMLPEAG